MQVKAQITKLTQKQEWLKLVQGQLQYVYLSPRLGFDSDSVSSHDLASKLSSALLACIGTLTMFTHFHHLTALLV